MRRRWHLYLQVLIKNMTLFIIGVLILDYMAVLGHINAELYNSDVYGDYLDMVSHLPESVKEVIEKHVSLEQLAREMAINALGLSSKKQLMKDHLQVVYDFLTHPLEKTRGGYEYYTYILKSLLLVVLTELFILTFGLYLGLRAGYKGGWADRLLSVLTPVFSAIPPWFIAVVLLYTLYWKVSLLPVDFEGYLRRTSIEGGAMPIAYVIGLLLPVLTLVVAMVWEYAFNIRNLVKFESTEGHVLYDRAKGLPDRKIMRKLLRTALPAFLTFTTYNFLEIMMSAFVVEVIFDIHGVGWILVYSFRLGHGVGGVTFHYNSYGVFFAAFVMMLFYFINAVVMESLYIHLDPRTGKEGPE
ncbi:ABC transporter permease subunit [Thermococcus sp. M36]|uniref:ABC transporter permease subunit n=1 Tax=Thermococcus sp. M36 TaxID=1638261 RepID=UPI00143B2675|nr:ABC transporter permease subunit [Thermococcus sp. M36]NJE05609.1 ABC transporter permease subunit [Thermococcus sp. M36]